MATLRPARAADAPSLVRLRRLMHADMGGPPGDDAYAQAAEAAFRRRLDGDPAFTAFVVEVDGAVVSCGAGWVEEHLPSPSQLDGRRGHIASMSTDAAHRRQGHGRQVFGALMGWMAEQGLRRVDLRATPDGQALYEAFGFRVLGGATMAWTAPGVQPGMPRSGQQTG